MPPSPGRAWSRKASISRTSRATRRAAPSTSSSTTRSGSPPTPKTRDEGQKFMVARVQELEEVLERTRKAGLKRHISPLAGLWSQYRGGPDRGTPEANTSVPMEKLRDLLRTLSRVPQGFVPHEKI